MERTQLPSSEQFQQKINSAVNSATQRYQAAITNPSTLNPSIQPTMHPAESFFAPPSANPRLTTCLVCGTPFQSHAELSQHVEQQHATLYRPSQVQMPPAQPFPPFPITNPILSLNPFPTHPQLRNPWAITSAPLQTPPLQPSPLQTSPLQTSPLQTSAMQTPISVPPSVKHVQPYRCDICDIGCDTSEILHAHLAGQKHRKKLDFREAFLKVAHNFHNESISQIDPRIWMCHLCQTKMDSENAVLQHLEATKHKRLRLNRPTGDHHKRLRSSPVTALQAADAAAATPVSAALAVLKDDTPALPPVSSLFPQPQLHPTPFPSTPLAPPPSHASRRPGPPRSAISKNQRPNPRNPSQQAPQSFSCAVCFVSCNSMDSLNAHLASIRHKRKQNLVEAGNNPAAIAPSPSSQNIRCEVCEVMICGQANFELHTKGKQHAKKLKAIGQEPASGAPQSPASTSISPTPTPPHSTQVTVTPIQPPVQLPAQPPSQPSVQPPAQSPFQAGIQPPFQTAILSPIQTAIQPPIQPPIQSPPTSAPAETKDPSSDPIKPTGDP